MNAGFDEAVVLAEVLESSSDVMAALDAFNTRAQRQGEALVKLSRLHFLDLTEANLAVRKARREAEEWLDRELATELPRFYPLVAFTRVGFVDILESYLARRAAVDHVLSRGSVEQAALLTEVRTAYCPRVPDSAKKAPRERY
jgi:hypothetical protein